MGRDSEAFASVSRGALKLKVDDSGKIKKSKHKKKKSKKSKNRDRSASPEMGKGLNKVDKEPNYRFAKDISKVRVFTVLSIKLLTILPCFLVIKKFISNVTVSFFINNVALEIIMANIFRKETLKSFHSDHSK